MTILLILLLITIFSISYKMHNEGFTQDYYPHFYNSNEIPCLPRIN